MIYHTHHHRVWYIIPVNSFTNFIWVCVPTFVLVIMGQIVRLVKLSRQSNTSPVSIQLQFSETSSSLYADHTLEDHVQSNNKQILTYITFTMLKAVSVTNAYIAAFFNVCILQWHIGNTSGVSLDEGIVFFDGIHLTSHDWPVVKYMCFDFDVGTH